MILKELGLIFLHPAKTGGSSISSIFIDVFKESKSYNENIFYGRNQDGIVCQHATKKYIENFIGHKNFIEYDKVMTVRNPYTRINSIYNYGIKYNTIIESTFEKFILNLPKHFKNHKIKKGIHISPQFLYYTPNCFQIRFENINSDFELFKKKYNIEQELPHIDHGITQKINNTFTREMTDIINYFYKKDFEIFNYKMK